MAWNCESAVRTVSTGVHGTAAQGYMAYMGMIFNPPRPDETTAGLSKSELAMDLFSIRMGLFVFVLSGCGRSARCNI
jgi:hypothetical protein